MNAEYDASQIQILEGLEAVRKRPGMYIGSISSKGLHNRTVICGSTPQIPARLPTAQSEYSLLLPYWVSA